jgi:hypothetical protein
MNYNLDKSSFNNEPTLVDKKLIIYFKDYKQNRPKGFFESTCTNCINFSKKNYGFILLFILLSVLLYVRYIEVNKKKKYIKKLVEQKKLKKQKIVKIDDE